MHDRLSPLAAAALLLSVSAAAGEPCPVAVDGKAAVPIVTAPTASPSIRQSAEALRGVLQRVTGAAFAVETGDGRAGIAVGLPGDFPTLAATDRLAAAGRAAGADPTARLAWLQGYALRSHARGIQVVGASELGVEYAVWDLLHRAGYRHFFPGAAWEVVPRAPTLTLDVDAVERPDYYDRRIACFGGERTWEWMIRNRVCVHGWDGRASFRPALPARWKGHLVETSHAYSYIVRDHPEVFKAHPEWMALSRGERGRSTFLCISNPGLRDFVARYAVDYLRKYPDRFSVSLEPTDGDGWCECPECAKLGKVSNRAVLLANAAAGAVGKAFPKDEIKLVGMLGYGFHWQPPDLKADDRVVVMVTTKTLCPGEGNNPPMDGRLAGWAKRARHLGVYDYWSVFDWGGWTPGHAPAADPAYLADVIPRYHRLGARCWLAEADESWGACGLGYYLASRLLWDVKEAKKADALTEDFLEQAFGPAKEPMRAFYTAVDGRRGSAPGNPNAIRARLAQMYPPLLRARGLARDTAVRRRVDQLLLYTRLSELLAEHYVSKARHDLGLGGVTADDGRESAKAFLRLAYQLRDTHLVNSRFLDQAWGRPYRLTVKDLAPAGAAAPPELTAADVDAIAAGAARRYGDAAAGKRPDGARFAARNGDRVLFDAGGFESPAGPALPADTPRVRWVAQGLKPQDVGVTGAASGDDDPDPADGKSYCRLRRESGETHLRVQFEPQAGGLVEVEWMVHGDPRGDGDNAMNFGLREGSRYRVCLLTKVTGDVMYLDGDGRYVDTGLDHDGLRWERWRIRYAPGADHFSLTVGGRTADRLPVASRGGVDGFEVRAAHSGARLYVDGLAGR